MPVVCPEQGLVRAFIISQSKYDTNKIIVNRSLFDGVDNSVGLYDKGYRDRW